MVTLLALLLIQYSAAPAPGNRFTLEVEKTGIMKGKKHTFSFPKYSGMLNYTPDNPASAKVEFTLDGASMVCEDDWVKPSDREKILDWGLNKMIEVKQYPEIRFVSERVEQTDPQHFKATGQLTMRGIAKPAAVALTKSEQGKAIVVDGVSTVDMTQWGMKPPSAALGTVGTKPEMQVRFHLLFVPR